ncbi:hypothetical protein JCM10450v2_000391 [Rhodotorula kratochvilovae]
MSAEPVATASGLVAAAHEEGHSSDPHQPGAVNGALDSQAASTTEQTANACLTSTLATEEESGEVGETGEATEDNEAEPARGPSYPLLADPSNPNSLFIANTPSGLPLASYLSPEKQHAEWLAEQEEERVEAEKAEQGREAKG